ncbi:MAG: glycosyltransferase, partial [Sphingobium sp.]
MATLLLWLACLAISLPVAVLALECAVGVARARGGRGGRIGPLAPPPPFAVLMPAHDEAAGIGRAVADVLAQLRPCDRLLVVADNCTDDTAAIARALGACVLERDDPLSRGKSHALKFGRRFMREDGEWNGVAVVILVDADCSPAPGALGRLAAASAGGGG